MHQLASIRFPFNQEFLPRSPLPSGHSKNCLGGKKAAIWETLAPKSCFNCVPSQLAIRKRQTDCLAQPRGGGERTACL